MSETIKLILSLSLSGSILALLLFLFKPLIKNKLSKSIQYCLWIVVLFRLVIPYSFEGSIMNHVFYEKQTAISPQSAVLPMDSTIENGPNSSIVPNVQQKLANGVYNGDTDHNRYLKDLFNQYALYLWLLGIIMALTVNLVGYIRFSKYLKQTNKPATHEQNKILIALLNERYHVRLARNPFVTTPMLLGILRPYIIIPDIDYDEKQLKNILLHEISHLRRYDIAVKWLTMIAASIHWFNPFMYFIKKEINHACELACDEAVIKDLSPAEKQDYGDTLISVVAEHKYPIGILQATMCEEKKSLKERLIAIMKYNKKSKFIMVFSVIFLGLIIFGALYLGAGVGIGKDTPDHDLIVGVDTLTYDLTEISKYKTPYVGNASKVGSIAGHLPAPDSYFKQQYISMKTSEKPYGLTIYYEAKSDTEYMGMWPIVTPDSAIETNSRMNALVAFCMIDNLDELTFAYRTSKSTGSLDESKYDTTFTFQRASFEEKYGELSVLAKNLDLLQDALQKK